jgi:hypothetical protein
MRSANLEGVAFVLRHPDHCSAGHGCDDKCVAGAIDRDSSSQKWSDLPARCSEPLSDKLAQSKGVICPPAGVDPQMQIAPPSGGHLKVIPPPGSPGGDPNVQPK